MKFVASYSGGKDSALALHRAVKQGHEPIFLLTTYNVEREGSFYHAIPEKMLEAVSNSLNIPLLLVKTSGTDYQERFEEALLKAKAQGAQACVFGDIDIEEHRRWPSERCTNTGLEPLFPLWGEDRKEIVYECIDSGFVADIVVVNTKHMGAEYLGQRLTRETLARIDKQGIDICGENGEYHTFVTGGPLFQKQISFSFGESIVENDYAYLPVQVC